MCAVIVLHCKLAPVTAGLCREILHGRNHTRHAYLLTVERLEIGQIAQLGLAHVVYYEGVVVQRMRREIEPDHLTLLVEYLQLVPIFGYGRSRRLYVDDGAAAEEALL